MSIFNRVKTLLTECIALFTLVSCHLDEAYKNAFVHGNHPLKRDLIIEVKNSIGMRFLSRLSILHIDDLSATRSE